MGGVSGVWAKGRRLSAGRPIAQRWRAAAIGALASSSAAAAQTTDGDTDRLLEQIEALRALVEAQAERIDALEAAQSTPSEPEVERLAVPQEAPQPETTTLVPAARQPIGRFPDDAIVTAGDFDGAVAVPGTDGSFRIGGFVRAEGNFDVDSLGGQFATLVNTIPLDDSSRDGETQTLFHVRNSRVNFDYRQPTQLGPLRTFVELDFFGDGSQLSNNFELRLRHAAAQLGNLYVGQWWSYFVDVASFVESADFIGPLGTPALRSPGIRWSQNVGERWRWGVGLENPEGDISGSDSALVSESTPNITGYVQTTQEWGRLRVAALGLELESESDSTFTGGVNITGRINTPLLGAQDAITFGGQVGSGFARQYTGFGGLGLDGVLNADGSVDATDVLAGYIAYQHWWTDRLRSNAHISALDLDAGDGAALTDLSESRKAVINLFWTPVDNATFGVDVVYAERETVGGDTGDGLRLQAAARFDF